MNNDAIQAIRDALALGLAFAESEVQQRKLSFKGHPRYWETEEEQVAEIKDAQSLLEGLITRLGAAESITSDPYDHMANNKVVDPAGCTTMAQHLASELVRKMPHVFINEKTQTSIVTVLTSAMETLQGKNPSHHTA